MTLYLSQLDLNPAHPEAEQDLASRYRMHKTLCLVRPDAGDRASAERIRTNRSRKTACSGGRMTARCSS